MEIQSESFLLNITLSIYVFTYEYHDKYRNNLRNEGNVNMDFHSHFPYDSSQNAATTFEHMKKFIHCMYEEILSIKDGIIYDNTYGCSKQYRFKNTL